MSIKTLSKLIKILGHKGPILTGRSARDFSPKTENKDTHEISFEKGKFLYWGANESYHNGDYYAETRAVLPATKKLVSACINALTATAVKKFEQQIRSDRDAQIKREAAQMLENKLNGENE